MVATSRYEAIPFTPSPERAEVVSAIMRGVLQFETVFNDYVKPCDGVCGQCAECFRALSAVSYMLAKADSRTWEVWGEDGLVGVLYLTEVLPGVDAKAHYVFFDRKLSDKTELIESLIQWCFEDHEDWKALRRITVEIPAHAFSVARHAHKRLGFGGDFVYRHNNKNLPVEGVRRNVFLWRGRHEDMIQMGRLRPEGDE